MLADASLRAEVKKVFVRSGVRFDYALADPDDTSFASCASIM